MKRHISNFLAGALIVTLIAVQSVTGEVKVEDLRDAGAYNNRGNTYGSKGSYALAIADYNKALEINPRHAKAYNNRGAAYYLKKEYDKAWEDVHKAQGLGYRVHPGFLNDLRQATGR